MTRFSHNPPPADLASSHPVAMAIEERKFQRDKTDLAAAMKRSEEFWAKRDEWLMTNGFVCSDGLPCWRGQVALELGDRGTFTPAKLRAWLAKDGRCCNGGAE